MAEEKGLVKYDARDGQQVTLSFDTIRRYLVSGKSELVTTQEMMFFMGICKSRGLNPFIKDCYLIKYSAGEGAAIITSIDYFRKRAKAQKDCKGWKKGIIIQRNGQIVYSNGLMLEGDVLLGGWFRAQPAGWEEPFELEVNLKGYIKRTREGAVTKFWAPENQPTQIMKVAESQGLRTLWPDEFQQLYTSEEMGEPDSFKGAEEIISHSPSVSVPAFDEEFGEEVKPFVETLMAHYKKTEDEIKIEAMKDIVGFIQGFNRWKEKQKPRNQPYPETPEVMRGPEPEPISYHSEAENKPERIEKAGPKDPFREEWIALRGAGFSTYVYKHLDQFRTAPYQQEAKVKWSKLYTEPWPLDPRPLPADWTPVGGTKVPEQTPAEEVAAGIHRRHEEEKQAKVGNGPSTWCPAKSGFVFTAVCQQRCDKTDKCQSYQEWEYENIPAERNGDDPPDPREDR